MKSESLKGVNVALRVLTGTFFVLAFALAGAVDGRPVPAVPPTFEPARVLHVSPFGDDENDGQAPDRAFRTISAAAEAVQPGDLVLVHGGTYFEHVHLTEAGTEDQPIVFRAAPGETALIVAGRAPEGWERIEETRHGYRAVHEAIPNYVIDERFLARYVEVTDLGTLDESPGSYLYDEDEQTIAVHPLRSLPPDELVVLVIGYTTGSGAGAAPGQRGYAYDKGLWTRAPYNRLEGFHIAYQPYGIQLRADFTEAWDNTVYGCAVTGIQAHTGENLVLANNVSFRNDGSGLHISSRAEAGRLAGNLSWGNTQKGPLLHRSAGGHSPQLALYGRVPDPTIEGNLVLTRVHPFERGTRLWRYKSALGTVTTRRNILVGGSGHVGWGDKALYENNTVIGGNFRVRGGRRPVVDPETAEDADSVARGNLYLNQEDEAAFADPGRWDFRLRSDSPYLGEGAWPDAAPVRYVSPEGDDEADGNTPSAAWRTLAHAGAAVRAGETVYVKPGEYAESVTITAKGEADAPIEFLTYGRGTVVLDGGDHDGPGIALKDAAHIKIDGFIFRGYEDMAVSVTGGREICFVDNVFDGSETAVEVSGTEKFRMENATFADCGRGVEAHAVSGRLVLRNNLLARGRETLADLDEDSRGVLISERNAFAGPDAQGQLEAWSTNIREGHPSKAVDVDVEGPDYLLPPLSRYGYAGIGRKPLGARGDAADESPVVVEDFRAAYVGTDRAVIEWYTPHDYANATLTAYDPDGGRQRNRIDQYGFGETLRKTRQTATLTDLTPGAEYELSLALRTPKGREGSESVTFTTLEEYREPTTLYVSPAGDDSNDGLSRRHSLATLSAAAFAASPGDTIIVGPGVYPETLTLACGGLDPERRLTVRSEQPGEAIIDLGGVRSSGIEARNVSHVTFDGFRFSGMTYGSIRHVISMRNAEDVEITNCIFERRPEGGVSCQLIGGSRVTGLRVHNNLFQYGFNNISLTHMDDVEIDRNTFYRAGVTAIYMHGMDDPEFRFTNNIFYDVSHRGRGAIDINRPTENLTVEHNLYYRSEDSLMGLVNFRQTSEGDPLPQTENPKTVEALQEEFGLGMNDRMGNPLFIDAENGDFRLQEDSPAIGMADDGGNVGMQEPPDGL